MVSSKCLSYWKIRILLVQFFYIVTVVVPACHLSCQPWMLTLRLFFQPLAFTIWFANCKLCNSAVYLSCLSQNQPKVYGARLGKVAFSHCCNCKTINPQPRFNSISWSLKTTSNLYNDCFLDCLIYFTDCENHVKSFIWKWFDTWK